MNEKKSNTNVRLNVPYREKNTAKNLGARWDPINRTWYVPSGKDLSLFAKWLPKSPARAASKPSPNPAPRTVPKTETGKPKVAVDNSIQKSNSNWFKWIWAIGILVIVYQCSKPKPSPPQSKGEFLLQEYRKKGHPKTCYAPIAYGAICEDGWESSSTGPGTCSHHGGVESYLCSP
ncbi:DUF5710 domain-containing protein [Advenella sp. FME57]|uniref:DUF5710 domain-containing protein n=1 Tax=Advenella sp. FME57 TaxID=2742604 RepID=UPI001D00EDDB